MDEELAARVDRALQKAHEEDNPLSGTQLGFLIHLFRACSLGGTDGP